MVTKVQRNPHVQALEKKVAALVKRSDQNGQDALAWLVKQCGTDRLQMAADSIDPKLAAKHASDAKLRNFTEAVFGNDWDEVSVLEQSYATVLESCFTSVQYAFNKATGTANTYNLGTLRAKIVAYKEIMDEMPAVGAHGKAMRCTIKLYTMPFGAHGFRTWLGFPTWGAWVPHLGRLGSPHGALGFPTWSA